VGIVAALLAFADVKTVIALVIHFPRANLLWFLVLSVIYEFIRYTQWRYLLRALHVRTPQRPQVFAFIMSEFSRNLPVGDYFQNYLLQQSTGADFSRTAAATTLILASEVTLCLLGVLILGLGAWTTPVRAVIIGGTALVVLLMLLLAWAYTRLRRSAWALRWVKEHKGPRTVARAVNRFREGAGDLFHPRILLIQGLLGAAYLLIASGGLYVVVQGLDPRLSIDFPQVAAVYLFALASAALFPAPEAGGVGAFLAFGVGRNVAVGAMLLNRVLSIAFALISAVVAIAVLPGEVRAVLQTRGRSMREVRALKDERLDIHVSGNAIR